MMGIIVMATALGSRVSSRVVSFASASTSPAATAFSCSICFLNRSRAMASMPKVLNSLRRMS